MTRVPRGVVRPLLLLAMASILLVGGAPAAGSSGAKSGGLLGRVARSAHIPSAGPPDVPARWRLGFSADFRGTRLDRSRWTTCYPWSVRRERGCSNGNELEWYRPSQVTVSGGVLHLTAARTPTRGFTRSGAPRTYPWRSGIVTTFGHFSFTYGYVQVVARVPRGKGLWPALWLLPTTESWPPEIDVMEVHGQDTDLVAFTNHPTEMGSQRDTLQTPDLAAGWHVFAVDWEPGSITWYLDDRPVFSVHTGVPDQPMYFLANLAVDGDPGMAPGPDTPGRASFDVKRVDVWQH